MSVQVLLQHMLFQIRGKQVLLNSRGFLNIGPGGNARCFVCGLPASWCMLADVNALLDVKAMFAEAGSDIEPIAHYSQVSACGQHENNLFDLCVLVHKNKDIITLSIIREAMEGAWFFEVPVVYRLYQDTQNNDGQRSSVEVLSGADGLPKEVNIHFARGTMLEQNHIPDVMDWLRKELAVKFDWRMLTALDNKLREISRLTEATEEDSR